MKGLVWLVELGWLVGAREERRMSLSKKRIGNNMN